MDNNKKNIFNIEENEEKQDIVAPILDLKKKKFRVMPDLTKEKFLFGLKTLDLSFNLIGKIDTQRQGKWLSPFSEMVNLEILNLSHNKIKYIHPNVFNGNKNIRVLDLSHNNLTQEGKLKCLSKLKNLEKLDISENEIYTLNYIKLSKYIKRTAANLKILFFKQIGQSHDDLVPDKKTKMRFKIECSNLQKWDFSEDEKNEKPKEKNFERRKSQPLIQNYSKSSQKVNEKSPHSKKFLNTRERRKSQISIQQQQKAPEFFKKEKFYSKTPTKLAKKKWITESPKVFKDITNLEEERRKEKEDKRVRTISKLISKVVKKTTIKKRKKSTIEFSEVKKNLKNFFKNAKNSTPVEEKIPHEKKRKYEIEDFENFQNSPERLRSSTPSFIEEQRFDDILRHSTAFRLDKSRSEFDRKFRNLKSMIGVKTDTCSLIPEENISKNQIISPSIFDQNGGISFGIAPKTPSKDAMNFKNMLG